MNNVKKKAPVSSGQKKTTAPIQSESKRELDLFEQIQIFTNDRVKYELGARNEYIHYFACNCNAAGISQIKCVYYVSETFDIFKEDLSRVTDIIKNAYKQDLRGEPGFFVAPRKRAAHPLAELTRPDLALTHNLLYEIIRAFKYDNVKFFKFELWANNSTHMHFYIDDEEYVYHFTDDGDLLPSCPDSELPAASTWKTLDGARFSQDPHVHTGFFVDVKRTDIDNSGGPHE